ncbi:MAG: hypothetical protein QME12_05840 [Nanoarchaeota archaeon]|nr:hypothetical protein [Nanoarchaeota archaeon]
MQKKKAGVFSFTCCEGCTVVFMELMNRHFFDYKSRFYFASFRHLKTGNKIQKMDFALIEGAISTASEKRKLLEIRKNAKKIIAIGSCAVTGMPSSQRNNFRPEIKKKIEKQIKQLHQLKTIEPLKKYVKVDLELSSCPVNAAQLEKAIEEL